MDDFEDAKDKVTLGLERRSLVLSEEDRRLTAYHEAGHTVVSLYTPGADPVHKVTIVPRGRALGVMHSLPERDRYGHTREFLVGRLAISFGGRVAEELIFGPSKVTTGAGSDIQVATNIARQMVTTFGMSERVGMMAVGDQGQEVFLGRDFAQRREISEHTARIVDEEVKALLDAAYERAHAILTEHRDLLDRVAGALLERETIDHDDVMVLFRGGTLPPRPPEPTEAPKPVAVPKPDAVPGRAPILGVPPAEPAGA
jgi:cell division protease FtsH